MQTLCKDAQLKIAFVTYEYPPFVYGGAGVYAGEIATHLAMRGHEVHVLTSAPASADHHPNIIVHHLDSGKIPVLRVPRFWLSLLWGFKAIAQRVGPFDAVMGNGFSEALLPAWLTGRPRITALHQSARETIRLLRPSIGERIRNVHNELGMLPFFDPVLVHRADRLVAVSEHVKDTLLRDYPFFPESHITVAYNGCTDMRYELSEQRERELRSELQIGDLPVFLFVGRVSDRRKGLISFLEAFSLASKTVDAALVAVGGGDAALFDGDLRKLGLEHRVRFVGIKRGDALKELYALCDAHVVSSWYETFGLTLAEAMSAEKPVIARSVGAIPEVVKPENGILVKGADTTELADAIVTLVQNRDAYKQVGKGNRSYVLETFSWDNAAKQVEQCICDALAERDNKQ